MCNLGPYDLTLKEVQLTVSEEGAAGRAIGGFEFTPLSIPLPNDGMRVSLIRTDTTVWASGTVTGEGH